MKYKLSVYLKHYWMLWAKALGQKGHHDERYADRIAYIRTIIAVINLITCFFIIAGVIRHW